MKEKNKVVLKM